MNVTIIQNLIRLAMLSLPIQLASSALAQHPSLYPPIIEPSFSIRSTETGQKVSRESYTTRASKVLIVEKGKLEIEAGAFVSDANSDTGPLKCAVEWVDSTEAGSKYLADNDTYPLNYFVTESIDVSTLRPNEITTFSMICKASGALTTQHDIEVQYLPTLDDVNINESIQP